MIATGVRVLRISSCRFLAIGTASNQFARLGQYKHIRMISQRVATLTHDLVKPVLNEKHRHEGGRVMKRENLEKFAEFYSHSTKGERLNILLFLARNYGSDQQAVVRQCQTIGELHNAERDKMTLLTAEQRLTQLLKPIYYVLFTQLGTLGDGVKFLIDMRCDALEAARRDDLEEGDSHLLTHISGHIKDILSMWFSVGLLQLHRITWETSAEILEKLARYEAVHVVKNWMDLKHRLGPNRRCYAFFHTSMPSEPLIVLHIALTKAISDSVSVILDYRSDDKEDEKPSDAECAIFYSITSTQNGLQGIELGAYLIQSVVASLKQELLQLSTFSSLSPIPGFRKWLLHGLKEETALHSLQPSDIALLDRAKYHAGYDGEATSFLKHIAKNLEHFRNQELVEILREPMMKLCATYLCNAKRRGYALDPVANFHLKNGAVVWRINWMADRSASGMQQSCGLMVNYRYYLEDMAENSSSYLSNQVIRTSELLKPLLYGNRQSNL